MATAAARSARRRPAGANRVASKVKEALLDEALVEASAVALSARIAGTAIAAVADLPIAARRRLTKHESELKTRIQGLVAALGGEVPLAQIDLPVPKEVEPLKGRGLGVVLSAEEGTRALDDYAVRRRVEDWAGAVAGPTELARDYGIPRSTLNHWQHDGAVIGLLKGTRKHVYPVAQFVDGRPIRGLSEINAVVDDPRIAWLWLTQANPPLGGAKPIDLLKRGRIQDVVEAARSYFAQP